LDNGTTLKRRPNDPISQQDIGESVWGGVFWSLRGSLTKERAGRLLATSWVSWRPSSSTNDVFVDFAKHILETDSSLGGQNAPVIRKILTDRKILPN
jgi:hypothetical protein